MNLVQLMLLEFDITSHYSKNCSNVTHVHLNSDITSVTI